ncbi:Cu+ exporting ATPase, partial [Dickeya dadantii]|nr:Cu+ exporting ATPase [Dickeya dadantii]
SGDVDSQTLIDTIEQAGYDAQLATTPDVSLQLSGLSCNHCVAATRKVLEAIPGVVATDVTKEQAAVYGNVEATTLISAIEDAGYHATVQESVHPKTEPLAQVATTPEALPAAESILPATTRHTTNADDSVQLLLQGMSCASCVNRVQTALQNVSGVTQARVNLAERSALVS